jgi:hypothetical protein
MFYYQKNINNNIVFSFFSANNVFACCKKYNKERNQKINLSPMPTRKLKELGEQILANVIDILG